ncbi:MAG: 4-oxalomesaconate tautomerase [Woeseiaceae bacterium]|nr:4-oxalomesaconate tautomerase [Woeseiaceae bacterium]
MRQKGIACTLMRGGTSKGLYFQSRDLPADTAGRDRVLLAAMGSPDARQIDGMGGAHPLTSKVAVIGPATRADADLDYLFLQVQVDTAEVRDNQNCGNILAGVGPFAIEQGLIPAQDGETAVRIHMVNTGSIAIARIRTPQGEVCYDGDARIDGVPGTAAPIMLDFEDVAGSNCGALLPTGNASDRVSDVDVTCIDNGMPVVIIRASDFGKTGSETPEALEADPVLKDRLESIRLAVGHGMNLGDVAKKTVPKMCLVSSPLSGGVIGTRTFIPHRVHESIGVLGAATVAAACLVPGSVAQQVSGFTPSSGTHRLDIEHPTGYLTVAIAARIDGESLSLERTSLLRTARKLMQGQVFVPASAWNGA